MILFTLFALFFAFYLLWRRARLAIGACAAALLWLIAAGWLATPLLHWAQTGAPDTAQVGFGARTIIVLLGSGTKYNSQGTLLPNRDALARIAKTAAVYEACKRHATNAACTVIVSGGNPQRHAKSEANTYAPYLLRQGVEQQDMVLENTSLNTYQNAKNVAQLLLQQHYDSLVLVTSAYHMTRAMLDFDRFGLAPQPVISNARTTRTGIAPRLSNLVNANIALHEIIGLVQFHAYRALGWY